MQLLPMTQEIMYFFFTQARRRFIHKFPFNININILDPTKINSFDCTGWHKCITFTRLTTVTHRYRRQKVILITNLNDYRDMSNTQPVILIKNCSKAVSEVVFSFQFSVVWDKIATFQFRTIFPLQMSTYLETPVMWLTDDEILNVVHSNIFHNELSTWI